MVRYSITNGLHGWFMGGVDLAGVFVRVGGCRLDCLRVCCSDHVDIMDALLVARVGVFGSGPGVRGLANSPTFGMVMPCGDMWLCVERVVSMWARFVGLVLW